MVRYVEVVPVLAPAPVPVPSCLSEIQIWHFVLRCSLSMCTFPQLTTIHNDFQIILTYILYSVIFSIQKYKKNISLIYNKIKHNIEEKLRLANKYVWTDEDTSASCIQMCWKNKLLIIESAGSAPTTSKWLRQKKISDKKRRNSVIVTHATQIDNVTMEKKQQHGVSVSDSEDEGETKVTTQGQVQEQGQGQGQGDKDELINISKNELGSKYSKNLLASRINAATTLTNFIREAFRSNMLKTYIQMYLNSIRHLQGIIRKHIKVNHSRFLCLNIIFHRFASRLSKCISG